MSCSHSDLETCGGNGVTDDQGRCTCNGPATGLGPSCSECSNSKTCNGKGEVSLPEAESQQTEQSGSSIPTTDDDWFNDEDLVVPRSRDDDYDPRSRDDRVDPRSRSSGGRGRRGTGRDDGGLGMFAGSCSQLLGELGSSCHSDRGFGGGLSDRDASTAAPTVEPAVVEIIPICKCTDPAVGEGPTCSEHSNSKTCNDDGVTDRQGRCTCHGPATGLGPSCSEHSNGKTCNDNGVTDSQGRCTLIAEKIEGLKSDEDQQFYTFVGVAVAISVMNAAVGYYVAARTFDQMNFRLHKLPRKAHKFVVFGVVFKIGDMPSDFGFVCITLGLPGDTDNSFYHTYELRDDHDADTLRTVALFFSIVGLLLTFPDV